MAAGSLLFVHGTGVRIRTYQRTLDVARKRAKECGVTLPLVECQWGDALGIPFDGTSLKSLPDEPDPAVARQQEEAELQWAYLDTDPFFELRLIAADPSRASKPVIGQQSAAEKFWDVVIASGKKPSLELLALLDRAGVRELWPAVWSTIVTGSPIPKQAVMASGNDTADSAMALARALFAELNVQAQMQDRPALGAVMRSQLVDRLRSDWGQQVYGLRALVKGFFAGVLRRRRRDWSERVSPQLGDILLYQARGAEIREFIRKKIETLEPPVYVLAHSLGGIACVDLLAMPNPPKIKGLVTAGSQAPLLYELGALHSLKPNVPLPSGFPPWLNLYDRNDFLSYVAHRLFTGVEDVEIESGELPLAAHSAYWNADATWAAVKKFVEP
jgi:hypothetical protein